jgi:hypothetical protein
MRGPETVWYCGLKESPFDAEDLGDDALHLAAIALDSPIRQG